MVSLKIRHLFLIVFIGLILSELAQSKKPLHRRQKWNNNKENRENKKSDNPPRQSAPQKAKDTSKPGTVTVNEQGVRRKIGPSGKEMIHNPRYNSVKAGKEAAQRNNRGKSSDVIKDQAHGKVRLQKGTASEQQKKDHYNKNKKGDKSTHFHSTDAKGNKLNDGIHHRVPKRG